MDFKKFTPFLLGLALLAATAAPNASAASISTVFAPNNSGGNNNPVMFDIQVLNPGGITISGIDVNIRNGEPIGASFVLDVYITPLTYVGSEQTPGAWTLMGSGSGISQAEDTPSFVDVSDFFLASGTYGIAFNTPTINQGYTNGANVFSNADVILTLGASAGGGFFSGGPNSPRTWNGTIYYDTDTPAVPEPSTVFLTLAGVGLVFMRRRRAC